MTATERAKTEGVLRAWTRACSMREQAVLCSSIRGCDGLSKRDPSKSIIWALRYDILYPSADDGADPTRFTSFMGIKVTLAHDLKEFLDDLDPYPFHFIQHLAHAAHIIAVRHTDERTGKFWRQLYESIIVDGMHALPEPDEVMIHRLRDR